MSSTPPYYEDTYHFDATAIVEAVRQDEKGWFVVLSNTLFYPQGGGQPSDVGHLKIDDLVIFVQTVRMVDKEIRHYIERGYPEIIGKSATLHLDEKKRVLHSKLHTSGHLISNIVESIYPAYRAVKGHHFPGESYVEFRAQEEEGAEVSLEKINQTISGEISSNKMVYSQFIAGDQLEEICGDLLYSIPTDQSIRIVGIEGFQYQPCGGTHVNMLGELRGLDVLKVKTKGRTLKVSYSIETE